MTSPPSTVSPSLAATRSMVTKSPSAAARSTGREGAEALTQRLDLLVDVGVGDLDVLDAGLEALVVGELEVGLHVDLGGELEGLVVLELRHLDLRLGQRLEVVLLERGHVLLRDDGVDRLVEDRAAADLAVDDRRRNLAAAEAGDVDLLRDLLVGRVEARLELLEGHLDGQLGPGRAQGLDGALHKCLLMLKVMGRPRGNVGVRGGGHARRDARRPQTSSVYRRVRPQAESRRACRSGRQDSNLRSPAPKAGALATTLRPAKPAPAPTDPARIERVWSLLGADDGNRTRVASLEDWGSTIELHPRARVDVAATSSSMRESWCHTRAPPAATQVSGGGRAAGPGRRCVTRARR